MSPDEEDLRHVLESIPPEGERVRSRRLREAMGLSPVRLSTDLPALVDLRAAAEQVFAAAGVKTRVAPDARLPLSALDCGPYWRQPRTAVQAAEQRQEREVRRLARKAAHIAVIEALDPADEVEAGRRRIVVRHEPPASDDGGFVECPRCTGFGDTPTEWPCGDWLDAAANLVAREA